MNNGPACPAAHRESFEIAGCDLSVLLAGDRTKPAMLLLHGFPNSSRIFRHLVPLVAQACFVIAPDLPGSGGSGLIADAGFPRFTDLVEALLGRLGVGSAYLYVHDYGAPVALDLAMREPRRVRGLVIQNANAHRTGFGPSWKDTIAYWQAPTKENEQRASAHLTPDGVRSQYVGGIPDDIAARIPAEGWIDDWRTMSRPGHLELQRALVRDYGNYVSRFDDIGRYLRDHQPPALMLWGRHDVFFDHAEILSWMEDLPRMEVHVLDGPHLLLETHAQRCARWIVDFVAQREAAS